MGEGQAGDVTVHGIGDLGPMRALIRQIAESTAVAVEDAVLAANELVTNALMYTPGPCRLQAWNRLPSGPLRIEVRDRTALPLASVAPAEPTAGDGRGLAIVEQLAARWGVRIHDGLGKTVWFEMDAGSAGSGSGSAGGWG